MSKKTSSCLYVQSTVHYYLLFIIISYSTSSLELRCIMLCYCILFFRGPGNSYVQTCACNPASVVRCFFVFICRSDIRRIKRARGACTYGANASKIDAFTLPGHAKRTRSPQHFLQLINRKCYSQAYCCILSS